MSAAPTPLILAETAVTVAGIYAVWWWWFLRRHHTAARQAAKESPVEGEPPPVCSFCGKSQDEVRKLIAGPKVYICDECIDLCNDIIFGEAPSIIRPLRMAWRALRWWMTGRVPPVEEEPSTSNFRTPE